MLPSPPNTPHSHRHTHTHSHKLTRTPTQPLSGGRAPCVEQNGTQSGALIMHDGTPEMWSHSPRPSLSQSHPTQDSVHAVQSQIQRQSTEETKRPLVTQTPLVSLDIPPPKLDLSSNLTQSNEIESLEKNGKPIRTRPVGQKKTNVFPSARLSTPSVRLVPVHFDNWSRGPGSRYKWRRCSCRHQLNGRRLVNVAVANRMRTRPAESPHRAGCWLT